MEKIYPRKLKRILVKEIKKPQITLITGMRQVGKTTLLKDIFNHIETENKIFIDLENPLNRKIFEEKNYDNVIGNLKVAGLKSEKNAYVFVDEIQIMPEISRVIKYLYDHYKIKFFLTGSSSFYLKNLFPESLAGRKVIYELYPLDFEEFLIFKNKKRRFFESFDEKAKNKNKIEFEMLKNLYEEYLNFGGFPAIVLEENVERKKLILGDIFKSYFEKDVKTLADFKEIGNLRDTILLLAGRSGSKIEISKISIEIGVSRQTIYSYLNFLEKTYFISLVLPYSKGINGEVRGARKVYLCDTGILNYLVKVDEGKIFETSIYNSLKRIGKINYYEKYRGPEIDFILNGEIAFEVKIFPTLTDLKRLKKICENLQIKKYYLISKNFVELENTIIGCDL
jgi:predicted AAA+ superfamily ATPase